MALARLDIGVVDCVAGRTESFSWEAYKADGRTPQAFESGDKVRFKIAVTAGGAPSIDLLSGTPSTEGSTLSIDVLGTNEVTPASGVLILDQDDTAGLSGTMHFEMDLVDASDGNRIKPFLRGKMRMLPSQGGSVGA